jgi:VanZ family protein
LHAFAYAVLALLLFAALRRGRTARGALVSAVAAWGYGLVIEGVQAALPYRTAEARDLIANAVGAVAPAAVSLLSRMGKEASR